MNPGKLEQIRRRLDAIAPLKNDAVRSVVLIGSVVLGMDEEGSDVDVVVVVRRKETEEDRKEGRSLWKSLCLDLPDEYDDFQFTVVDAEYLEKMFAIGSPFAQSVRNGVVLQDDGTVKRIMERDYPRTPTPEYYVTAFEWVASRYFNMVDIEDEIREDHAPGKWCSLDGCRGHSWGDVMGIVTFRMLYMTLPARGIMPRTKRDVIRHALTLYGEDIRPALDIALILSRGRHGADITAEEFDVLKPLLVMLWREVLGLVKHDEDAMKTLRAAAGAVRKFRKMKIKYDEEIDSR